jgi:hypothetical protein
MGIYRLGMLYPRLYKWLLLAISAGIAALGVWLLDDAWAHAIVASLIIVGIGLLLVVTAHLHFLNAFSLLYRPGMRDGALSEEESKAVLVWRASGDRERPKEARTRRIANIVYPGSNNPHGPLHRFISEIFDKNEPPLFKNFLRLDVGAGKVTITCFRATGLEQGPEDVDYEEPIQIPLPH